MTNLRRMLLNYLNARAQEAWDEMARQQARMNVYVIMLLKEGHTPYEAGRVYQEAEKEAAHLYQRARALWAEVDAIEQMTDDELRKWSATGE